MTVSDGIYYKILEETDLVQTIDCIVSVFPNEHPLLRALKITSEDFYPRAEAICKQAVKEGLSHIAKDERDGRVIGFRISLDSASNFLPVNPTKEIDQRLAKVRKFVDDYIREVMNLSDRGNEKN